MEENKIFLNSRSVFLKEIKNQYGNHIFYIVGKNGYTEDESYLLSYENQTKVAFWSWTANSGWIIKSEDISFFASQEDKDENQALWDADPNCDHNIVALWSGVKCTKCNGWFCY